MTAPPVRCLTSEELDRLELLAASAAAPPWRVESDNYDHTPTRVGIGEGDQCGQLTPNECALTTRLPIPDRHGGWTRGLDGGMSCYVEQHRYGHQAKKATWLYAVGVEPLDLRWGSSLDVKSDALVSWCGNRTGVFEDRTRLGKLAAISTPPAFRNELLRIARTVG